MKKKNAISTTNSNYSAVECLKISLLVFFYQTFLPYFKHLKEIINLLSFSKATYMVTFKLKQKRILLTTFKVSLII